MSGPLVDDELQELVDAILSPASGFERWNAKTCEMTAQARMGDLKEITRKSLEISPKTQALKTEASKVPMSPAPSEKPLSVDRTLAQALIEFHKSSLSRHKPAPASQAKLQGAKFEGVMIPEVEPEFKPTRFSKSYPLGSQPIFRSPTSRK